MRKARAAVGSLVFLVLAPGVVAGLVPWLLTGWHVRLPLPHSTPLRVGGLILIAAGVVVLLQAFVRFVVEGLGTPAPVAPTDHLVVGGLYRYVRNPMYLAVAAIIVGQALALGQPVLLLYAAAFGAAVAGSCTGTKSRLCAAGSASSTRRIGERCLPGGRAASRGRRTTSTIPDTRAGWKGRSADRDRRGDIARQVDENRGVLDEHRSGGRRP